MIKDEESRIATHVSGGYVNESYVENQQKIIQACYDKIEKRKKEKGV